jgi:hypothetical protein
VKIREKKENYKQKVKESFDIDEAWALANELNQFYARFDEHKMHGAVRERIIR